VTTLYPQQMRRIADMLDALNKIDGPSVPETEGITLMLKNGIPVVDEHGHVYGYLGDEVGGSWCFWPGPENPYKVKLPVPEMAQGAGQ
jgi:hypothetical protein